MRRLGFLAVAERSGESRPVRQGKPLNPTVPASERGAVATSAEGFYHLHVKNIGRRFGRSVVAAAAYRAGETLWNDAEERESAFGGRRDVLLAEIRLPASAPLWAADRTALWTAVEQAEKRKDARLAKEIEFSLPVQLPRAEWTIVARAMADAYVKQGFVVDLAIHEDGRGINPHVHLLLALRRIGAEGFGLKIREADSKTFILAARRQWQTIANAALGKAGAAVQIDARSYRARGIDRQPGKHRGPDPAARRANRDVAAQLRKIEMIKDGDAAALRAMLREDAWKRYTLLHRRDDWPPIYRNEPLDLSSGERIEFVAYWQEVESRKVPAQERAAIAASPEPDRSRQAPDDTSKPIFREPFERMPVSARALAQLDDLERRLDKRLAAERNPGEERDCLAWQEGFDAFRAQIAEIRELEAQNSLFAERDRERAVRAERNLPVPGPDETLAPARTHEQAQDRMMAEMERRGDAVPAPERVPPSEVPPEAMAKARDDLERQNEQPAEPQDALAWARQPRPAPTREPAAERRDELDWIPGRRDRTPVSEQEPDRDRER